jgi:hypothetical protein
MKNLHWEKIKNEVLDNCKKANITNKEFISTVLKVERRVDTCKNDLYVRGRSWDYVVQSKTAYQAMKALDLLNGRIFGEPKFLEEWKTYCNQQNTCWDSEFGDWMA